MRYLLSIFFLIMPLCLSTPLEAKTHKSSHKHHSKNKHHAKKHKSKKKKKPEQKTNIKKTIDLFNPDEALIATRFKPGYEKYSIGVWTYGTPRILEWGDNTTLTIGNYCSIADNVTIFLGGNHNIDCVTSFPFNKLWPQAFQMGNLNTSKGDVVIGHDVWVGYDSLILSGVSIGNGAVIAARSVVTKDVPAYAIVGGTPAKIIRMRFSADQIHWLQAIQWWNWPEEKVMAALPLLLDSNITPFILTYYGK